MCSRSEGATWAARRERRRARLRCRVVERDAAAAGHGRAAVLRVPEERVRDRNPVGRGYRARNGLGGGRGLVPRLQSLPWIPTDAQWRALLEVAAGESLRNRLMVALAYDAALRREELCLLATDDLDPAHRTLRVRAETTKTRRGRVVPYSAVAGRLLTGYLVHRRGITVARGALFVSESPRNRGEAVSPWAWSKIVRSIADRAVAAVQHAHAAASVLDGSGAVGVGASSDRVVRGASADRDDAALRPPVRPRSR